MVKDKITEYTKINKDAFKYIFDESNWNIDKMYDKVIENDFKIYDEYLNLDDEIESENNVEIFLCSETGIEIFTSIEHDDKNKIFDDIKNYKYHYNYYVYDYNYISDFKYNDCNDHNYYTRNDEMIYETFNIDNLKHHINEDNVKHNTYNDYIFKQTFNYKILNYPTVDDDFDNHVEDYTTNHFNYQIFDYQNFNDDFHYMVNTFNYDDDFVDHVVKYLNYDYHDFDLYHFIAHFNLYEYVDIFNAH